jgi:probable HAF family extracellular repeat protein
MTDLTPHSERTSAAYDINNDGAIVGEIGLFRGFQAVMWRGPALIDLGSTHGGSSAALAISDQGVVVGLSRNEMGENRAFVWTVATGMSDLNDLAPNSTLVLTEAWGINNGGSIVGVGLNAAGDQRAFLATPICFADCTGDGILDLFDFLCFQNLVAVGSPAADCDGDGELELFDFLCFQNKFAAGCP